MLSGGNKRRMWENSGTKKKARRTGPKQQQNKPVRNSSY